MLSTGHTQGQGWTRFGSALETLSSRVAGPVLDLLLPLSCAVCGREGQLLCSACEPSLPRLEQPYCSICAWPGRRGVCSRCTASPPAIGRIGAPYLFEGAVREMVHSFKYGNFRAAAPTLGALMADHLKRDPMSAGVLMPVPLHGGSERQRGYNQAELLARAIAREGGTPLESRALRRTKKTPPQVSMDGYAQRIGNIQGAFGCDGDLRGVNVLLIDDVVTTGSTMSACAQALKASGAGSVWGLVLARQR